MIVPAWIERLASDLLDLDAELRPLLRLLTVKAIAEGRGEPRAATTRGAAGYQSVTLSANEARTLLRAALPLPIGSTRLRQPHARMLAALQLFTAHLLTLNDETTTPDQAAVAGIALAAELRTWLDATRWHQACRAAGVRWPQDQPAETAITALTRQQTAAGSEQTVNTLAESHRITTDPMGAQVARTARRKAAAQAAEEDARDLAAAAAAAPPRIAALRTPAQETPAQAAARMQATARTIAAAAAATSPPRPPATVEVLHQIAAPTAPIATTTTRQRKAHAA